ncbi:MAG: hypothetical protein ACRDFR_01450 [Candidatus Limnocylindria bacterium]
MAYWDGQRWIADGPPRRRPDRGAQVTNWLATLLMLLLIPALLIVSAGAVAGAKPTSSVWINEANATTFPQSALRLGSPFSVGYSSKEREPWALVQCYPNATTVFSSTYEDGTVWASVFSVYPGGPSPQAFVVGASIYPIWTSGGADCVVRLVTYSHDLSRMAEHAASWYSIAP